MIICHEPSHPGCEGVDSSDTNHIAWGQFQPLDLGHQNTGCPAGSDCN